MTAEVSPRPSGTSVPVSQTQAGTAGNPTQTTLWSFQPAHTTDSLSPFALIFRPQTFGGIVETVLTFGYNPQQSITGDTGESAANFIIHPDAGDSTPSAMEMEFVFHFPDGGQGIPIQMGAARDNNRSWDVTIKHGDVAGDGIGFAYVGGTYASMSATAVSSAPGTAFALPVLTPAGSVLSCATFSFKGTDYTVKDASNTTLLTYNGSFQWVFDTTAGHDNLFIIKADATHKADFQMYNNGAVALEIVAGNPNTFYAGGVSVMQLYSTAVVIGNVATTLSGAVSFASATAIKSTSASVFQTTVGAAGAASALPATPSKYLKWQDNNATTYVIPMYLAA